VGVGVWGVGSREWGRGGLSSFRLWYDCRDGMEMTQPPILDYHLPVRQRTIDRRNGIVSLFAGSAGLLMNLLFWEGVFFGNVAILAIAFMVTVLLPIVGLVSAVSGKLPGWLAWVCALTSLTSAACTFGLCVYAVTHMPNC
jgi:hypothetical protein